MKKIYLIILSFLALAGNTYSQQIPLNDQYLYNRYMLSPTYSGINENPELFVGYRKERVGFPGSTILNMVNINTPLNEKMGFGANIMSDRTHIFKQTYASISYAYHAKLAEKHNLSFGMYAGVLENKIDFSSLDPEDYIYDDVVNDKINQKGIAFNIGAGLLYSFSGLRIGVDVPGLYESKVNYDTEDNHNDIQYILRRTYNPHLSYNIEINEKWEVEPIVISRIMPNTPLNWEAAALIKYNKALWLGFNYRSSSDMGVTAGGEISNKLCLNYTYEFSGNGVTGRSSGSHEIGIGYYFGRGKGSAKTNKDLELQKKYNQQLMNEIDSLNTRIVTLENEIDQLKKTSDPKLQSIVESLQANLDDLRLEIDKKEDVAADGHKGTEITGEGKTTTGETPAPGSKTYYVVIESYKIADNVPKGKAIWKEKGYESIDVYKEESGWYHLFTDKFTNINDALKRAKELRAKGVKGAWVLIYK